MALVAEAQFRTFEEPVDDQEIALDAIVDQFGLAVGAER